MMNKNWKKIIYLFLIFIIGSMIGWLYETGFDFCESGKFVNRGVLFGPWLPIYGIGAVSLYFLKPLKKNPFLLFILAMVITGVVEFLIGYMSVNVFDMRLWNYDGLFLNIEGIICLRSVVSFAVGALLFHYLLEPFMEKVYNKVNLNHTKIISIIILVIFIIDIILSVLYRKPPLY